MTGSDKENPIGYGLSELKLTTEEDFVFLTIPRSDLEGDMNVDEILEGEELSSEEETIYRPLLNHLSSVAQVPEVRGVILQEHPEVGIRLGYVVDQLVRDSLDTNRIMSTVGQANRELGEVLGRRVNYFFGQLRQANDFEEFLRGVREAEKIEDQVSSDNSFVNLMRSMTSGFKTVGAIKFEKN